MMKKSNNSDDPKHDHETIRNLVSFTSQPDEKVLQTPRKSPDLLTNPPIYLK